MARLALLLFLTLLLPCLGPEDAPAQLPPDRPTFFAGNPSTRRLAFRYRVGIRPLGPAEDATGVYGIFCQSSFWFLENEDRGYTVENNFAPEVMLLLDAGRLQRTASWWPGNLAVGLSYSHHSNGVDGPLSRSWNHLNLACWWAPAGDAPWRAALKVWAPFNIEAGNEDLAAYAGHGRLDLEFMPPDDLPVVGRTRLNLATHFSLDSGRPGVFTNLEASLALAPGWLRRPPFGQDPPRYAFFVQWVVGYGLSLIDYAEHRNTMRLGLRLF